MASVFAVLSSVSRFVCAAEVAAVNAVGGVSCRDVVGVVAAVVAVVVDCAGSVDAVYILTATVMRAASFAGCGGLAYV